MDFWDDVEDFVEVVEEVVIAETFIDPYSGYGRRAGYGYGYGPSIGVDVTSGDLVENFGNGIGIDLDTGQVELDLGGFDIPL